MIAVIVVDLTVTTPANRMAHAARARQRGRRVGSFDHLVGDSEHAPRAGKAERPGGLGVDGQLRT